MTENTKQLPVIDCFVSEVNNLHYEYECVLQQQLIVLGARKNKNYDFDMFLKDCHNDFIEIEILKDLPDLKFLYYTEIENYLEYHNNTQLKFDFN
ncbi:hypothetical protein [Chryseobacterium indologenes]